jgi:hypothetical protein
MNAAPAVDELEETTMGADNWEYRFASVPIEPSMEMAPPEDPTQDSMNSALSSLVEAGWEPLGMSGDGTGERVHLLLRRLRGFRF